MENMEVLVRGLVMQNAGVGMGSVGLQGVQLLWVVVVATVVLALVSVTRVSYVSVGWTWGSKPGQVRVRVQSFSSLLDDGIVSGGGMFSAEILNCSADSCSEDASSSVSESEAAEMVFIFEKKKSLSLPTQPCAPLLADPEKIVRKRSKSLDFQKTESLQRSKSFDLQKIESLLLSSPEPIGVPVSRPIVLREGIVWDAASGSVCASDVDALLPARAQSVANSALCAGPRVVKNASYEEWDPLLKLKIRDAVVSDGRGFFSSKDITFPLAPVAVRGSSVAALRDDAVRVWDSDTRCLVKSVCVATGGVDAVTAFDVNWELEAVAMARKGGLVFLMNLESAAHGNCYETQQPVVQAVYLDSSGAFSKTMLTGGPAGANPGCVIALWDSRSSRRELALGLTSASAIYGIRSQGEELYVRDEASSLAAHDMRMLGASSLCRVPCEVKRSGTAEDRWWDIDTTVEEEDDIDDDDFMDCQATAETKRASSMSSLVTVMSRSFSSKTLST